MKILVITHANLVIPPIHYGGTERVVSALCKGLVRNGHHVRLVSSKYSRIEGCKQYSLFEYTSSFLRRLVCRAQFQVVTAIACHGVDLVHSYNCWPEYHAYLNLTGLPLLYTQHNALKSEDLLRIFSGRKRSYLQCISNSQADIVSHSQMGREVFVCHNPADTDVIQPAQSPSRSYLAYLGRLNYDKGIDVAVRISRIMGIPLKIAGVIPTYEDGAQRLFDTEVRPYLGENIEYIGPIDDQQKSEFLGNAIALLMLNRWAEPFGIVMAESLAAGTPIVGTSIGSIPEIVDEGKTGYLVKDVSDLDGIVEAVNRCKSVDPAECRSAAVEKFSHNAFIERIERIYDSILAEV